MTAMFDATLGRAIPPATPETADAAGATGAALAVFGASTTAPFSAVARCLRCPTVRLSDCSPVRLSDCRTAPTAPTAPVSVRATLPSVRLSGIVTGDASIDTPPIGVISGPILARVSSPTASSSPAAANQPTTRVTRGRIRLRVTSAARAGTISAPTSSSADRMRDAPAINPRASATRAAHSSHVAA